MAYDTRGHSRHEGYDDPRDERSYRDIERERSAWGGPYGAPWYGLPYGFGAGGWWGERQNRDPRRRDREGGQTDRERGQERGFFERAGDELASWFGDDDASRRRDQDQRMEAVHRGRGPRSYSRSDDRIRDDINDRLTDDPYIDASDVSVSVRNGEVTLDGMVANRAVKRRSEDLAEAVVGVRHVQNNLRYHASSEASAGASALAGLSRSSDADSSHPSETTARSR